MKAKERIVCLLRNFVLKVLLSQLEKEMRKYGEKLPLFTARVHI